MTSGTLESALTLAQRKAGFSLLEVGDDYLWLMQDGERVAPFGQHATVDAIRAEANRIMEVQRVQLADLPF